MGSLARCKQEPGRSSEEVAGTPGAGILEPPEGWWPAAPSPFPWTGGALSWLCGGGCWSGRDEPASKALDHVTPVRYLEVQ